MFSPNSYDGSSMFEMMHRSSENELTERMIRDDDISGTEMDVPSGDDQDPRPQGSKKKNYHRHTQRQIQEMDAFFKECPHPDDKQRKQLSRDLGLDVLQIKFWFQNKRTQMKAQQERHENSLLKSENEKLRAEITRCKATHNNSTCRNCGGIAVPGEMSFDEQHLRIENSRLREEVGRLSAGASKYVGKHLTTSFPRGGMYGLQRKPTDADKPMIIELAVTAMEELMRMAQAEAPLWISGADSIDELNEDEYLRTSPMINIGSKPLGLRSEASRQAAVVIMNHVSLVETLMDVDQWSKVFCAIVSKATTLEVLSSGVAGSYNGALQVMTAEFQVSSPLVPTRDNYFVRYCKQHSEGTWAVVDVSLDNLRSSSIYKCRRRPSGCLIQELPNGYSKVIWVEHVEVDDRGIHEMYTPLTNSGLAFGAKRWVAILDRQCERLAASNIPAGDTCVATSPDGKKSMLKLGERMVASFCTGVGASTAHAWTTLSPSGDDDVRVMTRKSIDDPGSPTGVVLSAATSLWIPVSPNKVFDFLRAENSRSQWDILSNGSLPQEMAHIANGRDPGNCVSLIRSGNINQSNMLFIQESCSDATGSYVIYAPVDTAAMNQLFSGANPDYVALLPSGFAILPDGPAHNGSSGSLITVAFQILVDSIPSAKISLESLESVNSLVKYTVEKIKTAVMCGNA